MALWNSCKPQVGGIPVRAGSVEVLYAASLEHARDSRKQVDRWEKTIVGNPSPSQRDSLELARFAAQRWHEAHVLQRTASSIERLKDMVEDHPRLEVRVLAVARAKWLKAHRTVGFCTFRRTWCNNIALDAIAAHPVLDEQNESPIDGLGTGLIHHVCTVAAEIGASAIWGECTQNSFKFYRGMLDSPGKAEDLIVMPVGSYSILKRKLEEKWQSAGRKL